MNTKRPGLLLAFALTTLTVLTGMTAAPAFAQLQAGSIRGTVADQQGAVLPGATVRLTGADRTITFNTEEDGEYRFLDLAPGTYTLTVSLQGFTTVVREGIVVVVGRDVEVPVALPLASVEESITVSAASPVVDRRQMGTATNFTQDELARMPTARDPWALLRTVPGVIVDRVNLAGNETGQQSAYTAKATSGRESTWNLDGVIITDMAATGMTPSYFDYDAFAEVQVSTANHDIRQPTSGLGINFVLKRGTNRVRGTARGYFTNDALEAANVPAELRARGVTPATADHNDQITDVGLDAGGPLVRGRAWLWGAFSQQDIRLVRQAGRLVDRTRLQTTHLKGHWQATAQDLVSVLWYLGAKEKFGRPTGGAQREAPTAVWNQLNHYPAGPHGLLKLQDDRLFTPQLLLSAKYAYYGAGFKLEPRGGLDGQTSRNAVLSTTEGTTRGLYFLRPTHFVQADGHSFLAATGGSHDLKFGAGYRRADSFAQTLWPGDMIQGRIESPTDRRARLYREGAGNDRTQYVSFYLGDTFARDRLTLDAGLRYDRQWGAALPSHTAPNGAFPALLPGVRFDGYAAPFVWTDLTPRLGLTYALGAAHRTLLRASAGRYAGQLGNGTVGFMNPSSAVGFVDYPWPLDRDGDGFADPDEIDTTGPPLAFGGGFNPAAPTAVASANRLDPALQAPLTDSLTLGLERELRPHWALQVHYTWNRTTRHAYDPWRGVVPADYTQVATLTGTVPDGGAYALPVFQPRPERVAAGGNGRLRTNFDGYATRFQGVDLVLVKRLADRWMLRLATALNHATQHYAAAAPGGAFGNPTPTDGFGDAMALGTPVPQANALVDGGQYFQLSGGSGPGEIFLNGRWMLNLNGAYELPGALQLAANLYGRQGTPIPPVVPVNLGVDGPHLALATPTIDQWRLDPVWNLDLRAAKPLPLGRATLDLLVDVFNVFNSNVELQRNRVIGPAFLQLNQNLSPRVFRVGLRLTFE